MTNKQRKHKSKYPNYTELIWKIIQLKALGVSYKGIHDELGVPASTAHNWVCYWEKIPHNSFTLLKVIGEDYLSNPNITDRDKATILSWVQKNAKVLAEDTGRYYSLRQENDIAKRETSPIGDWKEDIWQ